MLQKIENQHNFVNQQADEVYYDFTSMHTPSHYIHWNPYFGEKGGWKETREEATDIELLRCAEESAAFEFLRDPAEDIYDLADGEVI